ncbi:hypothetical protein ABGB12_30130 [Actinocorallia sp. B10E7]|uniref:hypothetical protein n=1 Tax=Actinocorallia sp. B10E7 TaxID=3153558 RepID=UPI00325C7C25
MNHEELLRESRRILDEGGVETPAFITPVPGTFPLNCDIDNDVAVVTFLTSAPEKNVHYSEEYVFERIRGTWEYLGGGSASMGLPPPVRRTREELNGLHMRLTGHGLTRRRRHSLFPARRWISTAELQLSDEVAGLRLDDRPVRVPRHGIVSVVWPTLHPATATALAADGRTLASLTLEPRIWTPTPD